MKIEKYLHDNRISNIEFARKIGVSGGYITRLINGEKWPGHDVMSRIKMATGGVVTADDFLRDET